MGSEIEKRVEEKSLPWILTLFGTAVGAGILYLPLQAGISGVWAMVFLSLFILPVIYYSHTSVIRLLAVEKANLDYAGVVAHFLGRFAGLLVVAVFFLTFYAVLLSYILGLNANLGAYFVHTGIAETNWARGPFLSLAILFVFALIQMIDEKIVLAVMSFVSSVMIVFLFAISIYLIPFWNFSSFYQAPTSMGFFTDILRILPILTLSFVFFPAMSSMVTAFRRQDGWIRDEVLLKLQSIVLKTSVLLLFFVLLFVFSCLLSLTPEEFSHAIAENLNCLTILSFKEGVAPVLVNIGVMVGIAALFTSFIGVFFAVKEAGWEMLRKALHFFRRKGKQPEGSKKVQDIFLHLFIYLSLWIIAFFNPSVMDIFGLFVAPLVAIFLFILPIGILVKVKGFRIFRKLSNVLVLSVGTLLLFSYALGNLLQG
ncbi:serine transporter [Desulfobotulus alkaliphilus]|uniref:Serine transporter n=1 Tax=Desulfobotulus alkaliphilus TaxID=622671 RepID=A0A562R708_9BACT|nr:aromatic amino acid transport family protein [Desulfobotulus alkaliphilus]TWI64613.1 serine transporter [Desulfobotulus alkaliphilus]